MSNSKPKRPNKLQTVPAARVAILLDEINDRIQASNESAEDESPQPFVVTPAGNGWQIRFLMRDIRITVHLKRGYEPWRHRRWGKVKLLTPDAFTKLSWSYATVYDAQMFGFPKPNRNEELAPAVARDFLQVARDIIRAHPNATEPSFRRTA